MTGPSEGTAAGFRVVDRAASAGRVVVGVDGSPGSLAALTWALREARLRQVTLHVVLGWSHHPSWGAGLGGRSSLGYETSGGGPGDGLGGPRIPARFAAPPLTARGVEANAEKLAARVLDQTISDALDNDAGGAQQSVQITRAALPGQGAKVLVDEVTEWDLLVVGSRGHGAFVGALLGSVSHHVVAQAPCPVVVVPHRQAERTP